MPDPFVDVAVAYAHGCGVRQSGSVLCWGKNTYGELGGGERWAKPGVRRVSDLTDAVAVATGRNFTCAVTRAKAVACWGNNEDGQLGDGSGARPGALSLRPRMVAGLNDVVQLVAGEYHACALDGAGQVACWGSAADGQIGHDGARAFATPQIVPKLGPVRQLAAGRAHMCALLRDGTVACWGRNTERQLGDPTSGSKVLPVRVDGLPAGITALVAGDHHTCALDGGGRALCWGDNKRQQLGPATREPRRAEPSRVDALPAIVELAAGGDRTCGQAAPSSGSTTKWLCWGDGQARPVPWPAPATGLAVGQQRACGIAPTGNLTCLGNAADGALGPWQPATS